MAGLWRLKRVHLKLAGVSSAECRAPSNSTVGRYFVTMTGLGGAMKATAAVDYPEHRMAAERSTRPAFAHCAVHAVALAQVGLPAHPGGGDNAVIKAVRAGGERWMWGWPAKSHVRACTMPHAHMPSCAGWAPANQPLHTPKVHVQHGRYGAVRVLRGCWPGGCGVAPRRQHP